MSGDFGYRKLKRDVNFLSKIQIGNSVAVIGKIISDIYKDPDNGYSVYTINVNKKVELNEEGDILNEINVEGQIRATGYFDLGIGQHFLLSGEINTYKNEKQLSIKYCQYIEPTTEDGIISFLSSGLFKGIGEKIAEKIVKGYDKKGVFLEGLGIDTLEMIRELPETLTMIPGISTKKAHSIHETYLENMGYQNAMLFFQKYNITPNKILKIYKKYREKCVEIARKNPYQLANDIKGFGFKTCDEIARKLGLDPHSIERIKSGIVFTLQDAASAGHCFLTHEQLLLNTAENLSIICPLNIAKGLLISQATEEKIKILVERLTYSIERSKFEQMVSDAERDQQKKYKKDLRVVVDAIKPNEIEKALLEMADSEKIKKVEYKGKSCYYPYELYNTEKKTACYIRQIADSGSFDKQMEFDKLLQRGDIEKHIKDFEKTKGFSLEAKQRNAIYEAFETNFLLIIGEAGTGKTTVTEAIVHVLSKILGAKLNFILCSPTGRASKRLTEVTGYLAKTIHRVLEYQPPEGFTYNSTNKLPYNLVIVDEVSMLDINLAHDLLSAINTNKATKVIFIGDGEQLPSVGPGKVLLDIADSGVVKTVRLDVIKRQAEGSGIIKNAHRIIHGEMMETDNINKDFFVVHIEDKLKVAESILKSVARLLDKKRYNYTIDDIQVICPQKTSEIGTVELNKRLQHLVNPPSDKKKQLSRGENAIFRVGDKVMHYENNYDLVQFRLNNGKYEATYNRKSEPITGIFNGEVGKVTDIVTIKDVSGESEDLIEYLIVNYDGFYILYDKGVIDQLELCYATTVHKAQGSQYGVILAPAHYRNYLMLNRSLSYTLVSRAKKMCCIFGQEKAFKRMVENVIANDRNTRLKDLIREYDKYKDRLIA